MSRVVRTTSLDRSRPAPPAATRSAERERNASVLVVLLSIACTALAIFDLLLLASAG